MIGSGGRGTRSPRSYRGARAVAIPHTTVSSHRTVWLCTQDGTSSSLVNGALASS
jgi:hypothetical protein